LKKSLKNLEHLKRAPYREFNSPLAIEFATMTTFLVLAILVCVCSGQKCLTPMIGYDQFGGDLLYSSVVDQSACCSLCLDQSGCVGWSYRDYASGGGGCWLKNATSMPQESTGCVTAAVGATGSTLTTQQALHYVTGLCEMFTNSDYFGWDLVNGFVKVQTIQGCCNMCASTFNCTGWTYRAGCCWMKHVNSFFGSLLSVNPTTTAGKLATND